MSIENTIRGIFADELHVAAYNVRPETILGEISPDRLARIAHRIGSTFNVLADGEPAHYETWTSVGDAIDAIEKLLHGKRKVA